VFALGPIDFYLAVNDMIVGEAWILKLGTNVLSNDYITFIEENNAPPYYQMTGPTSVTTLGPTSFTYSSWVYSTGTIYLNDSLMLSSSFPLGNYSYIVNNTLYTQFISVHW